MPYTIAGLGNPGEEYKKTRHNTGRIMAEHIAEICDFADFKLNPKLKALVSKGEIMKENVVMVLPDNFMNRSGGSIAPLILNPKKAKNLIVIYDDLDLPIGKIKISIQQKFWRT